MKNNVFKAVLAALLFSFIAENALASSGTTAIQAMGEDLAGQLQVHIGTRRADLSQAGFIVTTPVNLDDLTQTSPLARLMAENLSMWLVRNGYTVRELRRSDAILMTPRTGEISLTRQTDNLFKTTAGAALLVTGTYTVLPDQVMFHIRILSAGSNQVLAMSPLSIPLNQETYALLDRNEKKGRTSLFAPSVQTSLPIQ